MKDNAVALDGRRAAAEQLRLAQNALKDNRQTDAIDLLKRVAANEQYLTAADRQAFHKCSAGLNLPGAGGPPEPPVVALPPAAATNGAQARFLVQQARTHFVQGDFDQAEKEAKDAAALKVVFARNEDSPARVLEDLSRSRVDASALLKASRAAPPAEGLRQGRTVRPSVREGEFHLVADPLGRHAGQGAQGHPGRAASPPWRRGRTRRNRRSAKRRRSRK